jgi:hypothetical protein
MQNALLEGNDVRVVLFASPTISFPVFKKLDFYMKTLVAFLAQCIYALFSFVFRCETFRFKDDDLLRLLEILNN